MSNYIPAAQLAKYTTRPELDDFDKWKDYIAGAKFDGVRCLLHVSEDGPKLYSRTAHEFTEHVPHLVEIFKDLPVGTTLDGELALVTGEIPILSESIPLVDFNLTMRIIGSLPAKSIDRQRLLGNLSMMVFDCLQYGLIEFRDASQVLRSSEVSKIVHDLNSEYVLKETVFTNPSEFAHVYDTLVSHKQEGIMLKNMFAPYAEGKRQNKAWYKVKDVCDADVFVSGYTSGEGKYTGLIGAIEFSVYDGDTIRYVGRCSGMDDALRILLTENKGVYIGKVFVVRYNELVGSKEFGTPRHPQFYGFRDDKLAEDCHIEQFRMNK